MNVCEMRRLIYYSVWDNTRQSLESIIESRLADMKELGGAWNVLICHPGRDLGSIGIPKNVIIRRTADCLCSEVYLLDSTKYIRHECQHRLNNLTCEHAEE